MILPSSVFPHANLAYFQAFPLRSLRLCESHFFNSAVGIPLARFAQDAENAEPILRSFLIKMSIAIGIAIGIQIDPDPDSDIDLEEQSLRRRSHL